MRASQVDGEECLVERLHAVGCEENDAAIVLGVVQTKMIHENCSEVVDVDELQNGDHIVVKYYFKQDHSALQPTAIKSYQVIPSAIQSLLHSYHPSSPSKSAVRPPRATLSKQCHTELKIW